MSINVSCPQCQKAFKVKEEYAGKRAKCPVCKAPILIPALEIPVPPPQPVRAPAPSPQPPAGDNPFAFDEAPPPPPPPPPPPRKKPAPPATPAPAAAAPAASDNPFAFDGAPAPPPAAEPVDDEPPPIASRRGGSRRADRRRSRESDDGDGAGSRRLGDWAGFAAGCGKVMVGTNVLAGSVALMFVGSLAIQSPSGAFTLFLLSAAGALVAYIFGVVGRASAKTAPDRGVSGPSGVSFTLSMVTAGLAGLTVLLLLLLQTGAFGGIDGLRTVLLLLLVSMFGGMICGAIAEVFFSKALMRVADLHGHKGLGTWALVTFIGFLAIAGLVALTLIIAFAGASERSGGAVPGAGGALGIILHIAVLAFAGLYNVPLVMAKGLSQGKPAPPARSRRRHDDDDMPTPFDEPGDAAGPAAGSAEEPFTLDGDEEPPRRPRR